MRVRQLFVALFAIALFTLAVRETLDPDMWWHLRTGETIVASGIPTHDVFTFTVPDHEWVTHEWLSQVFMWLVYVAAGLPGLILVFALLIAVTFGLLYACSVGRPYLAAFVVLLAAITSAIVWGARPQIFNLLMTAAFVFIVERVKQKKWTLRSFWALPVLMLFWANLHSGYLLGIVLLGTYAVGEAAQRLWAQPDEHTLPWTAVRRLALMAVISFLVAGINPSGPALWIYPFFTLGSSAMQAYIQEWHSPNFHLTYFWPFPLMAGAAVSGWIVGQKRPTLTDLLLFMGTAAAGLLSARHIPLFAIVSTPIVARAWYHAAVGTRVYPLFSEAVSSRVPSPIMKMLNWIVLLLAVVTAFVWTATKIMSNETAVAARYPVAAVDFLEQSGLAESRGYNSYNWGGYLIWRRIPVYVDGRADVYGDEFLFFYRRAFEVREDWERPLNEYDVDYVIMERASPLAVVLATHDGWAEAYRDDIAQVFIRVEAHQDE
jgi:hypothetical protein